MNINQVDGLVHRGFKLGLEAHEGIVMLRLESPEGECHSARGADVSEVVISALIETVVKLEYYLKQTENERDMYKAGLRPLYDIEEMVRPAFTDQQAKSTDK